jgi:hypothetical protein
MRLGLMAAEPGTLIATFLALKRQALKEFGIEIGVVILDTNLRKRVHPLRHAINVARRQARINGETTAGQIVNILFYKLLMSLPGTGNKTKDRVQITDVPVIRVGTLNDDVTSEKIRQYGCDLVCLMGARILTRETIQRLGVPIFNIHSSDPRIIRGGPPIVWEVLAGSQEIVLTVHRVTEDIDAGAIIEQQRHSILFGRGLGATTLKTMAAARPLVADLFERALLSYRTASTLEIGFSPGHLHVTPKVSEALKAEFWCRRAARRQSGREVRRKTLQSRT